MNIPMAKVASSLLSLITICCGKTASPAIITNELLHLFCPVYDWKVTPVLDHEFTVVFPDPVCLRYATHSAELTLALDNLAINIKVPTRDLTTVATLSMVWIQIHGLPPIARQDRVIRSMSEMLAMIIEVDLTSLAREKIVHARVKYPDPSKLQTSLRMFFNDSSYDLHISVEDATHGLPSHP
ncbi:hypothetical protein ZWY2020_039621 [Hordeum vulgare]|nr:hypothetical protein ZWY2020_039621 [Hordeum vulgare]